MYKRLWDVSQSSNGNLKAVLKTIAAVSRVHPPLKPPQGALTMKRRQFLAGAAAATAITTLDWLRFFRSFGVPGTTKELGIAEAAAAALNTSPRFLIYWFQEGGWDGYCMFNPVHTPNDATRVIPAGTLRPTPSWSQHRYRPKSYGTSPLNPPRTSGDIQYGYLAEDGRVAVPGHGGGLQPQRQHVPLGRPLGVPLRPLQRARCPACAGRTSAR